VSTTRHSMQVSIRLPDHRLYSGRAIKLYAQAENGAFGLLPDHTDYLTSLLPSVLIITQPDGQERYFGVDEGILVKHGRSVDIAVRRGLEGDALEGLAAQVYDAFVMDDEEERVARTALAKLELGMVKQLTELRRPT